MNLYRHHHIGARASTSTYESALSLACVMRGMGGLPGWHAAGPAEPAAVPGQRPAWLGVGGLPAGWQSAQWLSPHPPLEPWLPLTPWSAAHTHTHTDRLSGIQVRVQGGVEVDSCQWPAAHTHRHTHSQAVRVLGQGSGWDRKLIKQRQ